MEIFPKTIFGSLFLGVPVKWAFLFPKKKKGKMFYCGCYLFLGDNDSFLSPPLLLNFLIPENLEVIVYEKEEF